MIMAPPSDVTLQEKARLEAEALQPKSSDVAAIVPPKVVGTVPKKRRGPKGPNPLSVKKKIKSPIVQPPSRTKSVEGTSRVGEKRKQVAEDIEPESNTTPRKRKRRRKHINDTLVQQNDNFD
jgi:U3 small nucleolar RNA-associated protein 23